MNKSMLWTIASILTLSGLAVFAYLLWKDAPVSVGSFDLGNLTNMATLVITMFSLSVAVVTYQNRSRTVKNNKSVLMLVDCNFKRSSRLRPQSDVGECVRPSASPLLWGPGEEGPRCRLVDDFLPPTPRPHAEIHVGLPAVAWHEFLLLGLLNAGRFVVGQALH